MSHRQGLDQLAFVGCIFVLAQQGLKRLPCNLPFEREIEPPLQLSLCLHHPGQSFASLSGRGGLEHQLPYRLPADLRAPLSPTAKRDLNRRWDLSFGLSFLPLRPAGAGEEME